jgi:hypothetical protein
VKRLLQFQVLLILSMLASSCGVDNDAIHGISSPPQAEPPVPTVSGAYRLDLGDGQILELLLSQTGQSLEGDGAIFGDDDPLPVRVCGSLQRDGSGAIILHSADRDGRIDETRLDLVFGPGEVQVELADIDADLALPPAELQKISAEAPRALETLSWSLPLRIGGQATAIDVVLNPDQAAQSAGSWTIPADGVPLQVGSATFLAGQCELYLSSQSDWARLKLLDPSGVLPLGTLWFRTSTKELDPESFLFIEGGLTYIES